MLIDGSVQFMCCGQALRHRFIDHDNFARDKERERERERERQTDRQTDRQTAGARESFTHLDTPTIHGLCCRFC